jgi:chromosome segregation ATPase
MTEGNGKEHNLHCYDCSKQISGKKAIECAECGENFCKDHVKLNESDHSAVCLPCFKKKIHLEVTIEMEAEMLAAKTQLNTLKEKLKNCKKDLANKKAAIERYENQAKISEKTNFRKFENAEKKIEEEAQRGINLNTTLSSFAITLADTRASEEAAEHRLDCLQAEFAEVQSEYDILKQENHEMKFRIKDKTEKAKGYISYNRIRNAICEKCKHKIKISFRDEIIGGNQERSSIVASVMAERARSVIQKKSALGQENGEKPEDDKACKCLVF